MPLDEHPELTRHTQDPSLWMRDDLRKHGPFTSIAEQLNELKKFMRDIRTQSPWNDYVLKAGDTMTGQLTVNANYISLNSDAAYMPQFLLTSGYTGAAAGYFNFRKCRGGYGSPAIVQVADGLGGFIFQGYDGAAYQNACGFSGNVGATPGAGDMPGKLLFFTSPDGSTTVQTALAIDHNQMVICAKGFHVGNLGATPTDNDISCDGTIKTAAGKEYDLGGYTAGAPAADGYITMTIDGAVYQVLCNKV